MKPLVLAAAFVGVCTAIAAAQVSKTIPGDRVTVSATIEAIDRATREVTLKRENGEHVIVKVGPEVKKFDEMKVGDTITATYYDNVVVRLKEPGEKAVDTETGGVTGTAGAKPGGTAATQRTITATITAIDPNVPSITFEGPNNWVYSSRVQDKEALKKVKVGDRVDITWTEALLISVEPPAKK